MQTPIWLKEKRPSFPRIDRNVDVDVAIVGGGIAGVTAAYLLKKAGRSVALVDKERCGGGDTGHTTAHLTYVTDSRLSKLVDNFGREQALAVWDAGLAALYQLYAIVRNENIKCEFAWLPGYLHAGWNPAKADERPALKQDAALAEELGFSAAYMEYVPLADLPGICFSNQAAFHPIKYLSALLRTIPGEGSHVFEQSAVEAIRDEPPVVRAGGHDIRCDYLVVATHVPLQGNASTIRATLLQSKLAPYSSYAVGARLPAGTAHAALYWDTSDPYYYLRVEPRDGHDYAILGGEDHKTGQVEQTEERFRRLEGLMRTIFPEAQLCDRWSGQVIETNDGLPFIGETVPNQFVATGFSGNGMTFGTLAGMMACDAALGKASPWTGLFNPGRTHLKGGTLDYLKENVDYPYYMIRDRLASPDSNSPEGIANGEGRIITLDGKRVAAYRDEHGQLTQLSPVCGHMGCLVHWNQAEATWDCPCHGSRFHPTGELLAGPAESALVEHQPAVQTSTG